MTIALAIDWYRKMLWTAVLVGGPVIVAGVVIGLIVAVLQAATQVNDSAVAFAPKAVATIVTIVIAGPWMLATFVDYLQRTIVSIPHVVG